MERAKRKFLVKRNTVLGLVVKINKTRNKGIESCAVPRP